MHTRSETRGTPWLALFLLLFVALSLRLYGVDWDQGALFHPDERAILMKVEQLNVPSWQQLPDLLDAQKSPLNPHWFSYGSLPLYLLKAVQLLAGLFTDWRLFDLRLPGRAISALFSTASIALIFCVGLRWLGLRVGLLAALFATFAVIDIQLSHFFTVDTILTFCSIAALFFLTRVACWGKRTDSLYAGIFVGLALATKASAFVLGIPLVLAHLVYGISEPGETVSLSRLTTESESRFHSAIRHLLLSSLIIWVTLLIVQPYMFLDFATYWENVTWESQMVRRLVDVPYTRQYIDTPKYLYQMYQLGTYGLGPALGVLAWIGFAVALGSSSLRQKNFIWLSSHG
ncbi:MAG: glycosyltransferase family 39 protein [Candidatus Binatia bacterium]